MISRIQSQTLKDLMRQPRPKILVVTIGLSNAFAVTTLYMPQVVYPLVPRSVNQPGWVPITAVFLGYCIGNVNTAFNLVPCISKHVENHLLLLSVALILTGVAPTMSVFIGTCFLTGVGASVAQRLLGMAAHLAGPSWAGNTVAGCIATALLAVLGLRVWGEQLASALGWRPMFILMSIPFTIWFTYIRLIAGRDALEGARPAITQVAPVHTIRLVTSSIVLRRSMAQQAMVFASYNAAWVLLTAQLTPGERATASFWGPLAGIACLLGGGNLIDRGRIPWLNRFGNFAMLFLGCPLLLVAYAGFGGMAEHPSQNYQRALPLGMALIDAGMQLTLVANQTRVQAIGPASRGRLASLLTVCGSLGSTIGGGLSHFLWQYHGWQAALALVAVAAAGGLFIACAPTRTFSHKLSGKHERGLMCPAASPSSRRPH